MDNRVFAIIRLSLWGRGDIQADSLSFQEMNNHAILALPAKVLPMLSLSPELFDLWKKAVYQQMCFNAYYEHEQSLLPVTVPYVILKGSAASQYYPYPELRTMGDIDIMTSHEDYSAACNMLLEAGFTEHTVFDHDDVIRHRTFHKNDIVVEVHGYFAQLNDSDAAKYLDDLIIDNLNPSHFLPDFVNGLVILEHISQHLEEGIGLRQILDWMMFVDKCLPDERWPEFQMMSGRIGLTKLGIIVTRMCELYLGLSEHRWCAGAEKKTCEQLMEYIMRCGNFGTKLDYDRFTSERILTIAKSPKAFLKLLQSHGLKNWKKVQKYSFLAPFAWLYQLCRYIKKGFSRQNAVINLKEEIIYSSKRKKLFDELGVTQYAKGFAAFKNGRYIQDE